MTRGVPPPVSAPPQAEPPTTAVSIFTSMIAWVVSTIGSNAVLLAAAGILVIAVYLIRRGRFPGSGL
jgi:hypothetical protein